METSNSKVIVEAVASMAAMERVITASDAQNKTFPE
jgi:hypothetical protein